MKLSLHIQRLVIDEKLLQRADRAGLAQAIERELQQRLQEPARRQPAAREAPPAPVQALGDSLLAHVPLGASPPPVRGKAR